MKTESRARPWRTALTLIVIVVQLVIITAMANYNIADFVYAGF